MATKIQLDWHIVCSQMEIEELTNSSKIHLWIPKNKRHRLFDLIKHSGRQGFSGDWGPEIIYWHDQELVAKVWSTESRAAQIQYWIRDHMFV